MLAQTLLKMLAKSWYSEGMPFKSGSDLDLSKEAACSENWKTCNPSSYAVCVNAAALMRDTGGGCARVLPIDKVWF